MTGGSGALRPRKRGPGALVNLAAIVVLVAALRVATPIVVPILLALFLAFVSSPLVFRLARTKIPYNIAVAMVLLFELGGLVTLGLVVDRSAVQLRGRLPDYQRRLVALYEHAAAWMRDAGFAVEDEHLRELLDPAAVMGLIGGTVARMGSTISSALLVLFVLAFTLLDAARLWRQLEKRFAETTAGGMVLGRVSREVNRYLGVKTLTSGATGVAISVWLTIVGADFPVLWGLLAFLLNYIPTVGSLLAAIPPILIALLMKGPADAALVAAGYIAVNVIVGSLIEPRIMGKALGMSPVVVFLSMVIWGWVLGPVGALLSVPLTMILKIALHQTDDWAWIADLMSGPVRGERARAPESDTGTTPTSPSPSDAPVLRADDRVDVEADGAVAKDP
ncbi:MAG: AI-2E family transporter [Sandaracinaceae bacterium]|nr:AI-2E family transporter [Sandaracinaceae bacterium]